MAEKLSLNQMMLEWALQLLQGVGDAAKVVIDGNKLIVSADFDGVTHNMPLRPPVVTPPAAKQPKATATAHPKPRSATKAKAPTAPTPQVGRKSREEKVLAYLEERGNKGGAIMKLASMAGIKDKPRLTVQAILDELIEAGKVIKVGNLYRHAKFPKTNRGARPGTKRKNPGKAPAAAAKTEKKEPRTNKRGRKRAAGKKAAATKATGTATKKGKNAGRGKSSRAAGNKAKKASKKKAAEKPKALPPADETAVKSGDTSES